MDKMNPAPFLKWAGGKSQLLQQFERYIPSKFNKYIEPFIGGGALFFSLASQGKIKEAVLLDSNKELIDCYKVIKRNLNELVKYLKWYKNKYYKDNEYYYYVRSEIRNNLKLWKKVPIAKRVAITLFLNKTCFNGLYRVNSRNQFNVPIGHYKNPAVYQLDNLKADSEALKLAKVIKTCDFSQCLKYVAKDDFVYLDPPYDPLVGTVSFTSYTKKGFGKQEQIKLSKIYRELDKKGCKVMLSNSDTDFAKELYKDYRMKFVRASRMINCNANGRGEINEIIVMNY